MSIVLKVLSIFLGIMLITVGINYAAANAWSSEWGALAANNVLIIIISAALLVYGIFNTILWFRLRKVNRLDGWDLAGNIISILLGIILLVNHYASADLLKTLMRWIVPIGMLLLAIRNIRRAILLSKVDTVAGAVGGRVPWILYLVLGILMLVVSIAMLVNKEIAFMTMGLWLAIEIMSLGFSMIAFAFAA